MPRLRFRARRGPSTLERAYAVGARSGIARYREGQPGSWGIAVLSPGVSWWWTTRGTASAPLAWDRVRRAAIVVDLTREGCLCRRHPYVAPPVRVAPPLRRTQIALRTEARPDAVLWET